MICAHILHIIRPATGVDDRMASRVQGPAHSGVISVVDLLRGMATVQLQHVHTPRSKCVSIILDVPQCPRVSGTRLCAQIWRAWWDVRTYVRSIHHVEYTHTYLRRSPV